MQTEASTKPPELGTQAHAARYSSDSEIHVAVTYGEQRPTIMIQVSRENAFSNTTSNNAEDLWFAKQLWQPAANGWLDVNPLEMG